MRGSVSRAQVELVARGPDHRTGSCFDPTLPITDAVQWITGSSFLPARGQASRE